MLLCLHKHRLICVVDSVENNDQTPSTIDASPNYLHIHILKPINQLKIAKSDGTFRAPITAIKADSAARIIQNFWRQNHNDGRQS